MAGEWQTLRLEDCMDAIIDYRGKSPEKTTAGVPLVTAKIVKSGRILPPEEYIAEKDYLAWMRRGMPAAGDVVMTTEAPLGEVAQLDGRRVALAQRVITLRGKPHLVDNTFLKFLLQSAPVQEELRNRSTGTTVLGIRQSELRKVALPLPPLPEQKRIAHVLGTLDDKIELNRRMNATLEAMSRAIFKSWFVDFDPVRQKAAGKQPVGMDAETAALFPDSFEESELGEVPTGWEVGSVSNVGNVVCGKTPSTKKSEFFGGDVPFITIPDMHRKVFASTTNRTLSKLGVESQPKKMLPPNSICVSCIATPGLVVITTKQSQTNQQINSVIPKDSENYCFWYYTLAGLANEIKAGGSGGSVLNNLSTGRFSCLVVNSATEALRCHYTRTTSPIFETMLSNSEQSRTLAALRDTLLPKLLSGEIRVSEAAEAVEEAVG